jgi:hypothetical protein
MVVLGVDPHKRTHTVVAVDEAGRQSVSSLSVRARRVIFMRSGGPGSSGTTGGGPLRTLARWLADWSATCWA